LAGFDRERASELPISAGDIAHINGQRSIVIPWIQTRLLDLVARGDLNGVDLPAMKAAVLRLAAEWPGLPHERCEYRIREHAVEAFIARVRPDLDRLEARWEMLALCAVAPRVTERPSWVRVAPGVAAHVSEGGYLMLSDDVAAAVSKGGEVRTVLTRQSDPGPGHEQL
jgi:hypothetical protein